MTTPINNQFDLLQFQGWFFYICIMTTEELVLFYKENVVPNGTKINAATTILNSEKFLKTNLDMIQNWKGDLSKCPSYWHLCELAEIIKGNRPEISQQ